MSNLNNLTGKKVFREYILSKISEFDFNLIEQPNYFFGYGWDEKFRLILGFYNKNEEINVWMSTLNLVE